jgi:thioredoxin 1
VRGIPTLIVFRNGQEVSRSIGARSPATLENLFTAALGEETQPERGIAPNTRLLRLISSAALLLLGLFSGPSWLLIGVAGLVFFSAVYDRCPIWQALSPRLARLARRLRPSQEQT